MSPFTRRENIKVRPTPSWKPTRSPAPRRWKSVSTLSKQIADRGLLVGEKYNYGKILGLIGLTLVLAACGSKDLSEEKSRTSEELKQLSQRALTGQTDR